jgi:hypothetical protein
MSEEVQPDRTYKHIKKIMKGHVKKWAPLLGLSDWILDVEYTWDSDHSGPPGLIVGGRAFSSWQYLRGILHFFLPSLVHYREEDLEEVAVHELLHLIMEQATYEEATGLDQERVVTEVARALLRVDRAK